MRLVVFPLGLSLRMPNDTVGHRVASLLLKPGEARDRLTRGLFLGDPDDVTGRLEDALDKVIRAEPVEKRLRAQQLVKPDLMDIAQWFDQLLEQQKINQEEAGLLIAAQEATLDVIMVDEFAPGEFIQGRQSASRVA
jgi:acyl-CoA dehydrogenase